jgi:hypothetical protein
MIEELSQDSVMSKTSENFIIEEASEHSVNSHYSGKDMS